MLNENRIVALKHLRTVFTAGALGSLPDGRLLERFLAGRGDADSSSAFAALVERHGPMVLGVCRDILRNHHDAEDAAQATFLILAKNAASVRRHESLASWLFGVALRVAGRSKAQATRRAAIERRGGYMKVQWGHEGPADSMAELHEEISRLPDRYRAPIVLCHLEGLSNEQAASQLGVPVRTIQRRLAQGRERLRVRLERRGLVSSVGLLGARFGTLTGSEAWLETTVQAAAGLAAGQKVAAVASAAVSALTEGVLTMLFISRVKIAVTGLTVAAAVVLALVGASAAVAARKPAEPIAAQLDLTQAVDAEETRINRWIRGIVVDTSGKPVGRARVTFRSGGQPRFAASKADGTFAITCDETTLHDVSLQAVAENGALQGMYRFVDEKTGPQDPRSIARIVLKPAREVAISVVDARKAPVAGARVFLLEYAFVLDQGRTDPRGTITFRAPVDALLHCIYAYKPGVGFDYFENYPSRLLIKSRWSSYYYFESDPARPLGWSAVPERADLILNGVRTVRVRALDSSDRPVPGIEIMPQTIYKSGKVGAIALLDSPVRAVTDAQGVATFDSLPADVQDWTRFEVVARGYSPLTRPVVNMNGGNEFTVHVYRATSISGRVKRLDGSPAPGILVMAENLTAIWPVSTARTRTAADGSYTMDLPPEQPYGVFVMDDEWAAVNKNIFVREGEPQAGIDLTLDKGALVSGRITVGDPPQPAPGMTMALTAEILLNLPAQGRDRGPRPLGSSIRTTTAGTCSASRPEGTPLSGRNNPAG